jgi:hypothetical protein
MDGDELIDRISVASSWRMPWSHDRQNPMLLAGLLRQMVDTHLDGGGSVQDGTRNRWSQGLKARHLVDASAQTFTQASVTQGNDLDEWLRQLNQAELFLFIDERRLRALVEAMDSRIAGLNVADSELVDSSTQLQAVPPAHLQAPGAPGVGGRFMTLHSRFQRIGGEVCWQPTIWSWSHHPESKAYGPEAPEPKNATPWSLEMHQVILFDLLADAHAFMDILESTFESSDSMRERDTHALFPTFCVAGIAKAPDDPAAYFSGDLQVLTRQLSEAILRTDDPLSANLSTGVIRGRFLAIRGEQATDRSVAPAYLLLPLETAGRDEREFERNAWQVVAELAAVEHEIGLGSWSHLTWLDLYENRLHRYVEAADQAATLIDPLIRYLPVSGSRGTDRIHDTITLAHETLAQGEGDIAQLTTDALSLIKSVEEWRAQVLEQGRAIQEHTLSTHRPLLESWSRAGLAFSLEKRSGGLIETCARARSAYESVLGNISRLFEERRVRDVGALEGTALRLNIVIGVLTIALTADLLVNVRATLPKGWVLPIRLVLAGLLAFGLAFLPRAVWRMRRRPIGTRMYRSLMERYVRYQRLLADSDGSTSRQSVNERDQLVARTLAAICDEVALASRAEALQTRRRESFRADVTRLARRIEIWSVDTLLRTERPFPLFELPLPMTACVYRVSLGMSDLELSRTLVRQCSASLQSSANSLADWGERRSAKGGNGGLVDGLTQIGLRYRMSQRDVHEMLRRILGGEDSEPTAAR